MKPEADPITEDEWLIRLVWHDRFTDRTPIISPNSFEPRTKGHHPDVDGISLFRRDCLNDPTDVLLVIPEDKRPQYGIVQVPFTLLRDLGLSVRPSHIDTVRGHVVVPAMSAAAYSADKTRFKPWITLMTGADQAGIMERWKKVAEAEPDERRRSDYAGLALVFADAAGRRQLWSEALKGWNMRQSQQVLEWQQEARVEERRLILSDILSGKFGAIPADLTQTIQESADADALRRWVSAAIKATTLDEFRQSAGI